MSKHFGIIKDKYGWVIDSDVPRLVTEAETIEKLNTKLREMIPELLLLNNLITNNYTNNITFELTNS